MGEYEQASRRPSSPMFNRQLTMWIIPAKAAAKQLSGAEKIDG
jgi:hypothetical protein